MLLREGQPCIRVFSVSLRTRRRVNQTRTSYTHKVQRTDIAIKYVSTGTAGTRANGRRTCFRFSENGTYCVRSGGPVMAGRGVDRSGWGRLDRGFPMDQPPRGASTRFAAVEGWLVLASEGSFGARNITSWGRGRENGARAGLGVG